MSDKKGFLNDNSEPEPSDREIKREEEEEFATTGARASDDPIQEILDEGQPAGHPAGQLRGDQTEGHRGGSRRQTQNRGRN
jgi:hypothetical protein